MPRLRALLPIAVACAFSGLPATAFAQQPSDPDSAQSQETAATGGAEYGTAQPDAFPTVPGPFAVIREDGTAAAPQDAPDQVKQIIWAANRIVGLPYKYGGGHGEDFEDTAYDCSGTVSYALSGASLLRRPRDSRSFFRWGAGGKGTWITVFTNSGHAYMTVAGIRLDTSAADDRGGLKGPRWRPLRKSDRGFRTRHPVGL